MLEREQFLKKISNVEKKILLRSPICFEKLYVKNFVEGKTLEESILNIFNLTYGHCTIYAKNGDTQTRACAKRSPQDIYLLLHFYGVKISYLDFYYTLLKMSEDSRILSFWRCSTINQIVFWLRKYDSNEGTDLNFFDEHSISPYEIYSYFNETLCCHNITYNSLLLKTGDTYYKTFYKHKSTILKTHITKNIPYLHQEYFTDHKFRDYDGRVYGRECVQELFFLNTLIINSKGRLKEEYKERTSFNMDLFIKSTTRNDYYKIKTRYFFTDEFELEPKDSDVIHLPCLPEQDWLDKNWHI